MDVLLDTANRSEEGKCIWKLVLVLLNGIVRVGAMNPLRVVNVVLAKYDLSLNNNLTHYRNHRGFGWSWERLDLCVCVPDHHARWPCKMTVLIHWWAENFRKTYLLKIMSELYRSRSSIAQTPAEVHFTNLCCWGEKGSNTKVRQELSEKNILKGLFS